MAGSPNDDRIRNITREDGSVKGQSDKKKKEVKEIEAKKKAYRKWQEKKKKEEK